MCTSSMLASRAVCHVRNSCSLGECFTIIVYDVGFYLLSAHATEQAMFHCYQTARMFCTRITLSVLPGPCPVVKALCARPKQAGYFSLLLVFGCSKLKDSADGSCTECFELSTWYSRQQSLNLSVLHPRHPTP